MGALSRRQLRAYFAREIRARERRRKIMLASPVFLWKYTRTTNGDRWMLRAALIGDALHVLASRSDDRRYGRSLLRRHRTKAPARRYRSGRTAATHYSHAGWTIGGNAQPNPCSSRTAARILSANFELPGSGVLCPTGAPAEITATSRISSAICPIQASYRGLSAQEWKRSNSIWQLY